MNRHLLRVLSVEAGVAGIVQRRSLVPMAAESLECRHILAHSAQSEPEIVVDRRVVRVDEN